MRQRILTFLCVLCLLPGLAQAKIFLADTDDTLRVVTASGVSTIHMYAAWADMTTTALTPGNSDAQVTTATTTVLVAAPGASTYRQIKGLSIRNSHASSSNVITVQFFDGATATELIQYTLLAGETLQWGEDENFRVIDASGQVKGQVALATGTNSVGQVTANAGTNLNTSSLLTTSAHDAAFGTAGSADSQVRSVQGIASMTPLLVNPGTATNFGVYAEDSVHASGDNLVLAGVVRSDAAAALAADGDRTVLQVDANGYLKVVNINPNLAADNSTLSTSKVPVLPGTVSTSAPTWTNGNQSALSLQTDGSVRSAVTNTVTVTASNLDVQIGGSDSLTIGTFPDNEPFNIAQMNGVTVSMGIGASGTGTQRVASLLHDGTDTAQVTATAGGSLQVECTSGCGGSGGTSIADDAAFTPGTTSVTPAGAMFDDVTPDSVNEGDAGVVRMSANRNLYTTLRDSAGNERGANVNASNELLVAATGTVTANAGTNLNTSALLTTSAHDAAFGTAGSADSQVRTVQGIASMTPLQVQSNSASLATEASVDGLEGGLGAAADAAATAGSTGSVTAKLRLITSQLDTISTNLSSLLTSSQLVDDDQTGASVHHRVSVGTTEDEHEIKSSAGRLFSISVTNTNAAARYLRCANQVAASTTPGTTTVFYGMAIPGATTGAGFTVNFGPMGLAFSTALTCWLVTGAAETDVAEVAANEINVNYTYK
jgi:hypothetical protein